MEKVQFVISAGTIVDIIMPDNVTTLNLKTPEGSGLTFVNVDLSTMNRRYENVDTLVIDSTIGWITIQNCQFPNVKKVVSKNKKFASSDGLLIYENTLLNTFEKGKNEEIDMSNVYSVNPEAFNGCQSTNLVNLSRHVIYHSYVMYHSYDNIEAMSGSAFQMQDGVMVIGNSVVRAEAGAMLHFTTNINSISTGARENITAIAVKNSAELRAFCKFISQSMSDVDLHIQMTMTEEDANTLIRQASCMQNYICDVEQSDYLTDDGILYSKDKSTLLKFPECKKCEEFIIPDCVTKIGERAFFNTYNLKSVVMPDSVTEIGQAAFTYSSIESIRLSRQLTKIPDGDGRNMRVGCFEGSSLTKITIPENLQYIGRAAFCRAHLKDVVFEEGGAQVIGEAAFAKTNLSEVCLPESTEMLGENAFDAITINTIRLKSIPYGLIDAVTSNADPAFSSRFAGKALIMYYNKIPAIIAKFKTAMTNHIILHLQMTTDSGNWISPYDTFEIYKNLPTQRTDMTEMTIEILMHFSDIKSECVENCKNYLQRNAGRILTGLLGQTEIFVCIIQMIDYDRDVLEALLQRAEENKCAVESAYILKKMNAGNDCDIGLEI